jgi:hypothetical protein
MEIYVNAASRQGNENHSAVTVYGKEVESLRVSIFFQPRDQCATPLMRTGEEVAM